MKHDKLDYIRCMTMVVVLLVFGAFLRVQYDITKVLKKIHIIK